LTSVQCILQLKLCWYTTVHLLLEEFKNFSQVIRKYTIIMSHNKSYKSESVSDVGPGVAVGSPTKIQWLRNPHTWPHS